MAEKSAWEQDREEYMQDPEFARAYKESRARFELSAALIGRLDQARAARKMSKAAIARQIGVPAPSVRRFFTQRDPNPGLGLTLQIVDALGLELMPKEESRAKVRRQPAMNVAARVSHRVRA